MLGHLSPLSWREALVTLSKPKSWLHHISVHTRITVIIIHRCEYILRPYTTPPRKLLAVWVLLTQHLWAPQVGVALSSMQVPSAFVPSLSPLTEAQREEQLWHSALLCTPWPSSLWFCLWSGPRAARQHPLYPFAARLRFLCREGAREAIQSQPSPQHLLSELAEATAWTDPGLICKTERGTNSQHIHKTWFLSFWFSPNIVALHRPRSCLSQRSEAALQISFFYRPPPWRWLPSQWCADWQKQRGLNCRRLITDSGGKGPGGGVNRGR